MPNYPYDDLGLPLDTTNLERLNNNYDQIQADIQSADSASQQRDTAITSDYNAKLNAQKMEYTGRLDAQNSDYTTQLNLQKTDYTTKINVQKQVIDNLVVDGDSSPEAAQARVGLYGEDYPTLKSRIDGDLTDISVGQINKARGKLDQTYLSDELLQQIAGETPVNAIPADASLTPNKFAFPVLSGEQGKNLFDKTSIENDRYIVGETGATFESTGFFVSSFIRVTPNTSYAYQPQATLGRIAFYDADKAFVSYVDNATVITTASNVYYVRLAQDNVNLNITQFEKGIAQTTYEPYLVVLKNDSIKDNSIDESKLSFGLVQGVPSKNLFNKQTVALDKYLNGATGQMFEIANFFVSDFITITPSTSYAYQPQAELGRIAFYDANKSFISYVDNTTVVTSPSVAYFVRLAQATVNLNITQLEIGTSPTSYETFGLKIAEDAILFKTDLKAKQPLLKTFNDAWTKWSMNEKYPVAFFGDSTTDGWNTTGWELNTVGTDHQPPNAYCTILQGHIQTATGKNLPRIYNAGFSGQTAKWATNNLEQIFGQETPYSDVEMVGISFGINDRTLYENVEDYRAGFKADLKYLIDWFYSQSIQPFLLTTQATVEPAPDTANASQTMRTSFHIETIANEVKKDLATAYGLELIDVNLFTQRFMEFSSYSLQSVIADKLHFNDVGHVYEAGLMFNHITPVATTFKTTGRIDFTNQRNKSEIPSDLITYTTGDSEGFKVIANYSKTGTSDVKIMDVWVFNDADRKLTLNAYKTNGSSATYVKVNGVNTNLNTVTKTIGELELGLHHIQVFTGASTLVDFKGFKLV